MVNKDKLKDLEEHRNVDALMRILNHTNEFVRSEAVEALGNIGDSKAVEGLIIALDDRDKFVRWRAANALGNIGDLE